MGDPNTSIKTAAPAQGRPEESGRAWQARAGWLAVLLVILLQFGLFHQFATREVVWSYPANHDQICYLAQSYETYEAILNNGLAAGLRHGMRIQSPNGALMHLQAALLFLLLGAGRLSALTINFGYFVLLQLSLVGTVRWLTRRWDVAFLALGLLLTAVTPFFHQGGLMDFRLDFGAFCLFGVLLCAVVRSRTYASRPWALVCGAAAAWLIVFRFITVVYLTGIAGLFLPCVLARLWLRRRDPEAALVERRRLTGLLLAGAVTALATAPVLWERREIIKAYYVFGHVTGPEKAIRSQKSGNPYTYYPTSLLANHAGLDFVKLGAVALAAALTVPGLRRNPPRPGSRLGRWDPWGVAALVASALALRVLFSVHDLNAPSLDRLTRAAWWGALALGLGVIQRVRRPASGRGVGFDGAAFCLLILSLLVPLAVLTVNSHRSPVVANVTLPSVLWLTVLGVIALRGPADARPARPLPHLLFTVLGAAALGTGLFAQAAQYSQRTRATVCRRDTEQILQLHDFIEQCCEDYRWNSPVISATTTVDYLHHQVAQVLMYERHGAFRRTNSALGYGIVAMSEADALANVLRSDILLFTRPAPPVYPFDHSMLDAAQRLRACCEEDLLRLRTFRIFGKDVTVYVRPTLRVAGDAEGWITSEGLTLRGDGRAVRKCKRVELRGAADYGLLGAVPGVTAQLAVAGRSPRPIPAALEPCGTSYRITLDLPSTEIAPDESFTIRLTFDRHFALTGPDAIERKLVVRTPDEVKLAR